MLIKQNSLFKNKYSFCVRCSKVFIKSNTRYVFWLDIVCCSMKFFLAFGHDLNKHEIKDHQKLSLNGITSGTSLIRNI